MAEIIATWTDLNGIAGSTIGTPTNLCPTYSQIIATGKINVSQSYANNQLVEKRHCSKKQTLINNFPYSSTWVITVGMYDTHGVNIIVPYAAKSTLNISGVIVEGASERPITNFNVTLGAGSSYVYAGAYQELIPGNGIGVQIESVTPTSDSTYRYWY